MTVLVSRLGDIENREHRGGDNEQCPIYQVTPRTNPLATAKCKRDRRVASECPIVVEESLGIEYFWIWIEIWVVQNRPKNSPSENYLARQLLVHTMSS